MPRLLWYAYGLTALVLVTVGIPVLIEQFGQRDTPGILLGSMLTGVGSIWLLDFALRTRRN